MLTSKLYMTSLIALAGILTGCGGDQPAAPDASATDKRGQRMYAQCGACHSLEAGGPNMVGPNLYGIFDRKAGLAPGFAYSDALTNTDVVWTEKTMDQWLARPSEFLPGNRMITPGIQDPGARASLIAYLQQATGAQQETEVE